jgi:hypothetical protein
VGSARGASRLACLTLAASLAAGCGTETATEPPVPPPPAGATAEEPALSLESGPFVPERPELFGPPYYPDAPGFAPARTPDRAPEPTELLRRAESLVGARDAALVGRARELFGDPRVEALVPHPGLRAGLVSLLGTVAEPAIAWLLEGDRFALVDFADLDGPDAARSLTGADGRQRIVFASRFGSEEPGLLSVVLAHEALHSDGRVSDLEELVATALQALVHMQQLLANPTLAREETELAQATNAWALIRLNTRAPGASDLRLVLPDGGPSVLPGGLDRPYFAAFFDPAAPPTPGSAYLEALVGAVAVAEPPAQIAFDIATVELLDAGQAALGNAELLEVADLLYLVPASTAFAQR